MTPSALFIIESDPRQSSRPAEAVRIAAGVGAWKKVNVAVYLRDAAVLVLGEEAEALIDGGNYARYLPVLRELGGPVYVQKGSALLGELGRPASPFEEIYDDQLAEMAAARNCVLRF
jgi:sulfur relay (sulfurtransferase) DsrF/TusC family protein